MPPPDPATQERRKRLGNAIRRHRQDRGWTQEELALRAGYDRKSVNRLENGTYGPSVDRLYPLADALGVEVAAFFADPAFRPARPKN